MIDLFNVSKRNFNGEVEAKLLEKEFRNA